MTNQFKFKNVFLINGIGENIFLTNTIFPIWYQFLTTDLPHFAFNWQVIWVFIIFSIIYWGGQNRTMSVDI